jgi:hypothetical protein
LEERGFVCLGNNGGLLSDLIEYNPESDTWTLRAAFGGSERKSAVSFVIDNKAYVGTGKGYSGKKDSWYVYAPSNYAALDELEAALSSYPNPVVEHLNIAGLQGNQINLAIYNALGVKVRELDLNGVEHTTIDLSTLQAGSYVLYFGLADGQTLTKKITKI